MISNERGQKIYRIQLLPILHFYYFTQRKVGNDEVNSVIYLEKIKSLKLIKVLRVSAFYKKMNHKK